MNTHHLKIWPDHFEAVRSGLKTFEVRKDDRDFQVGDLLHLNEYDPDKGQFTGQFMRVKVTYKIAGGYFGIEKGYCVLGFEHIITAK